MSGAEELLVMENFSMVEPGVYRSAFPRSKNVAFLARLGLKSVVSLVPEDYPDKLLEHYKRLGIRLIPMGIDGNKWPFKAIDMPKFREALAALLRPEHRPCLVHCNKGKHRTGCLIASLRLVRGWGLSPAFAEYLTFSGARGRLEDQIFIEMFYRNIKRSGDLQALLSEEEAAKQVLVALAKGGGGEGTDTRPVVPVAESANINGGTEKEPATVFLSP